VFDPRTTFVLGGVRIGIGCMNLVAAISRYTRVPRNLNLPSSLTRTPPHPPTSIQRGRGETETCGVLLYQLEITGGT